MIHQPMGGSGERTQQTDFEILAREMKKTRDRLEGIIAKHCGKSAEQVHQDAERDNWMTAEEALAYGLVDKVVASRFSTDEKAE